MFDVLRVICCKLLSVMIVSYMYIRAVCFTSVLCIVCESTIATPSSRR